MMIGRLNHVAIAVRDLAAASRLYRETLGAEVSEPASRMFLAANRPPLRRNMRK
jgi:catechol 2,3-dioxygenase-like lactoylglutathione lyase family enzyme